MKNTTLKCWVRAKKHYHFRFSRRDFSSHCLGVLFTSRTFKDLVLGLSWRGNPEPAGVGGVCQQRFGWWHRERKMLEKGCLRTTAFKSKTSFWCQCCLSISGSRWRPTAKTIPSMPYLLALKVSISQGKIEVDNWIPLSCEFWNCAPPRISLWSVVLNLLHELMHSFGAQHDPEPQCLPPDMVIKQFLKMLYSKLD